jgi:hypothetical protein
MTSQVFHCEAANCSRDGSSVRLGAFDTLLDGVASRSRTSLPKRSRASRGDSPGSPDFARCSAAISSSFSRAGSVDGDRSFIVAMLSPKKRAARRRPQWGSK